jgi:hypothetical protein
MPRSKSAFKRARTVFETPATESDGGIDINTLNMVASIIHPNCNVLTAIDREHKKQDQMRGVAVRNRLRQKLQAKA